MRNDEARFKSMFDKFALQNSLHVKDTDGIFKRKPILHIDKSRSLQSALKQMR